MKNLLFALGFSACSITGFAQTEAGNATAQNDRKNEIGIFMHNAMGSASINSTDVDMMGIQYSRWKNERIGYRIMAAHGNNYAIGDVFRKTVNVDTFIDMRTRRVVVMLKIGAAAQIQRKFYKRVYLFAAVELNVGYGKGKQDTLIDKTYMTSSYHYENSGDIFGRPASDVKMWHVSLWPTVGAKLVFSRIAAGVEFFGVDATFSSVTVNKRSQGLFDFDMGNVGQRLFFNYRFN
eukprot:Opistho-1_new@414